MKANSLVPSFITVLFTAALLTACAQETSVTQSPRTGNPAQSEETSTATAEPDTPQDIAIPVTCDEVLPPETVQSYDSRLTLIGEGQQARSTVSELLGPVTVSTLMSGTSQTYCGWGIENSDAIAYLGVASLGERERVDLLAALRDSVYEEVASDGPNTRFTQAARSGHPYTDDILVGDSLLVAVSHTIAGNFAADAFDQITQVSKVLE